MMGKIYLLSGLFLCGVALSGAISWSAATFPEIRQWAFFLCLLACGLIALATLFDDAIANYLGMDWKSYIALLVGIVATIFIGGLIQWHS